ncbi:hypothetical protein HANVADRAFT_52538, partial [Hanseniaspora valbyensis NRRL Y-1626]
MSKTSIENFFSYFAIKHHKTAKEKMVKDRTDTYFKKIYFDKKSQSYKTRISFRKKFIFFGLFFCCSLGIPVGNN